jgi:hypothetical protein
MRDNELLDEKVVFQRGPFRRVRRWWRGVHPDKGPIILGWSGWETLEEADRVLPLHTFAVGELGRG